eukprot:8040593-Pyramimonas_sp.AAC.2
MADQTQGGVPANISLDVPVSVQPAVADGGGGGGAVPPAPPAVRVVKSSSNDGRSQVRGLNRCK